VRLPRDLSGAELARALAVFGYRPTRQTGSHIRLTTSTPAEHHVTVPAHTSLRLGTLRAVLAEVAAAQGLELAEVARRLFER
jgi:predicted RNA binding protein YcfA (HicA-like mRNA interferase family)